jgi:thiol-disulfide isomerase/thioredoxin
VIALVAGGAGYDLYLETPPVWQDTQTVTIDTRQWAAAPEFSFTDTNGVSHKLADFKGKIVLLDFWATWCPTCVSEFPAIVKFVAGYKGDVVLIALSSDSGVDPVRNFIARQSAATQAALRQPYVFIAIDDKRAITRNVFLTEMYPETIFIAPDQHMVKKSVGATHWDEPEMTAFFEALEKSAF